VTVAMDVSAEPGDGLDEQLVRQLTRSLWSRHDHAGGQPPTNSGIRRLATTIQTMAARGRSGRLLQARCYRKTDLVQKRYT
jgi:hypothetical protein